MREIHHTWRALLAIVVLLLANASAIAAPASVDGGARLDVVKETRNCADLAAVDLTQIGGTGSKVTSATAVEREGKTYCEVSATLAPTIDFKVVLPVGRWTQRYLQLGCGGLCGNIGLEVGAADRCAPLTAGEFAVSSTDMGHQGPAPDFGRDPQKRVDFAYRGVHLTALASKKLIAAYYGKAPAYSYFNGCSDGGREALMEAQRYPDDFNGIIGGAPAMLFQFQNSLHHAWLAASNTGADGQPIVLAARLPLLHQAVVAACDGLDGQVDGLISDPRLCHFEPKTLICKADSKDPSACLSAAEADAIGKFYAGPRDPASGERLTVGSVQYGSELAWRGIFVPEDGSRPIFSSIIALGALQNLIFAQDPPAGYSLADFQFTKATVEQLKARHPLFDTSNPDLSAFQASGGKLILWHGWADEHISPLTTIAYQEALEKQMGSAKTSQFERLYLLPGVNHCGGGEGPSAIDLLTAMMNWAERGQAPAALITRTATERGNNFGQPPDAKTGRGAPPPRPQAAVQRSRPVYPYPAIARYTGSGDANDAANYVAAQPLYSKPTQPWAGEDFFKPYAPSAQ